ncbi:small glutamine-rich tetratricopeptide repeat-containing protein beta [Teleopsis dalmanni]|uniref:small glutamine-rich tetratricopeptide repeat-containing protein beta n=1 Tax=Teleopsis dalmanni TaxID=139649 RepID=UPI000D32AD72|nr:small glutamine-rich tetratricopeptide repeat-containing protein beta [Teleopsis dalmanni]XP_037957238.1 small glutamine-rich tetratricopeptide repeat-containing protein beta [Teleopsis dalmanni]XP_037957239.1 small glutamine-rich tetratricopeptide repeat-containing protein beta [Teleopsis dalmanni]XP_037957240.1 small glutamine-rich tetratricopeptide repeat-containing protein beta [Teleopsis dalmanni]XP_037957241.1 small glutamine-rich tetratricopeptide repeat-containing protein beta [Teleo
MQDEIQKTFIRSFVDYLKRQIDLNVLSSDAQESVEVAVQCLQAAFDLEEPEGEQSSKESAENAPAGTSATEKIEAKEIDLFEMFQSLYIERKPESLQLAETIKNEGNRLMKDGKYNEALLQYNRAITFDPKNPIFYCNRAAAYIRLGDSDRAVTDCKSALVYNPSYSKAYGRLGIAYSNLGKYEEAQQAYTKAIELEPDNQDYRNNLEVARNARRQLPTSAPQITEGLSAMLSNPAIRNIFNSAEIDLEQLQNMSQNPLIMNAIGQMFSNINGAPAAGSPPIPNDMLHIFQSLVNHLSSVPPPSPQNNGGNNRNNSQQPPPSS